LAADLMEKIRDNHKIEGNHCTSDILSKGSNWGLPELFKFFQVTAGCA